MPRIFISYRRDDTRAMTGRIQDRLEMAFGEENIFKDVDDIPPGADFRQVLGKALAECDVLLVVIGSRWLAVTTAAGMPRLEDPDDFVRFEIATALKREGMIVIPVLVENATMPTPSDLPDEIRTLAFRNAVVVRHDPDFRRDMDRLIEQMKRLHAASLPETEAPPPPAINGGTNSGSRVESNSQVSSRLTSEDYGLPVRAASSQSKAASIVPLMLGVLIVGLLIGGIVFALVTNGGNGDDSLLVTLDSAQLADRQATLEVQLFADSSGVTFLEDPYGWGPGTTLYVVFDTAIYSDVHDRDNTFIGTATQGTVFVVSSDEPRYFYEQWNQELYILVESGDVTGWVNTQYLVEG